MSKKTKNTKKTEKTEKKTQRQMRIQYLLDYYPGELQHFIEEGAYRIQSDLALTSEETWLFRDEDGLLNRNENQSIPDDLLAAWWKKRFDEEKERSEKMYEAISDLQRTVENL